MTKKINPRKGLLAFFYIFSSKLRRVTNYTYDKAGNRLTETDSAASSTTTYTYNEQNRLLRTDKSLPGGITESTVYSYDNNGNMIYTAEETRKPVVSGGQPTLTGYIEGETSESKVVFYQYDGLNQLIYSSTGDKIAAYSYNGEGLRVAKKVNGETTRYLYEYDKIVLEVNGSGVQISKNVYGTDLFFKKIGSSTYFYKYNGHSDVTALLDSSGNIAATYYYDAFGVVLERTGNIGNNIGYAGYQYDEETGLYYLNARMYSPNLARFLQEDTYRGSRDNPLSLNLYTYCHNEPIMYYDPTGHWEVGDEKLSAKAQSQISRWTNEYYAAEKAGNTKAMEEAHKKAEAVRQNAAATASAKNVTPEGASKTAAISSSTKSDSSGNYITADTWVSVGGTISTKITVQTSSSSSSSNSVKPVASGGDSVYSGTPSANVAAMLPAGYKSTATLGYTLLPVSYTQNVANSSTNGSERIVVSGGVYSKSQQMNGEFIYEFIEPAIKQLKTYMSDAYGITVTWIIADAGWSDLDKVNFSRSLEVNFSGAVTIKYISNSSELIDYFNNMEGNGRSLNRITDISIFSHGLNNNIPLGFNYSSDRNIDLDFQQDQILSIDPNAFDNAYAQFYSCNTGTGANSFAQAWVDQVGGKAWAVRHKEGETNAQTVYSNINGGQPFPYKISRLFNGFSLFGSSDLPVASNNAYFTMFK